MTAYVSPIVFTQVAQSIPPNVFADMDRKVAAAVAGGADVIDLAKGNPDAFPADFIRDAAKRAVDDPANARYSPFDGKPDFLEAAEQWYRNTYDVDLDWRTQLFAVEGAVDGLAALFAVLVSAGDAVAYADPYYPSYHCMTVMSRAEEILLPSLPERGFLPDLDDVPNEVWDRVKVLILNYPNNPTGAHAPREFLEQAIRLAHEHRFAIVQDFAYAGLGVESQQVSILSLPGAFDVAVEVCSLSKMYAMAGWRAGFIAGNDDIVAHVKQYHYQMGSMVTGSVQDAGTAALRSNQDCVAELASRYALRRGIVAEGLRDAGLDVFDSDGGIYAWVHAPEGLTGEQFADLLLERAAVAALPGTCFGKVGVDYVRFSLLKSEDQLREAVRRIAAVL
jgi:L-glutamine---4-(methylsulfanyl)-2-oxobutanoate aminotransferase